MNKELKNVNFGYDDFFESNRKRLKLDGFSIARVVSENKGSYRVINESGEFLAKITGKQIFNALSREDYPAVGDWLAITELNNEQAVINAILPRKTIIKRKHGRDDKKTETQIIGTNIDVAFIVESIDRDFNLNRIERYFAIAIDGGVKPAIIINKIDLISEEDLNLKIDQIKNRFNNIDIILTSAVTNQGLNLLKKYISKGKTYCFLGSSGIGKSSLINKLLGEDIIKTGEISNFSNRGKHVTTKREMYFLKQGGIVIDNPGMREVGMTDVNQGIEDLFDEIAILGKKCKYSDCTHTNEPGCEVLKALKNGHIDKIKYSNYMNLKKEVEYYEMSEREKKEKERDFGRFINNAKKEIKKYKDNF